MAGDLSFASRLVRHQRALVLAYQRVVFLVRNLEERRLVPRHPREVRLDSRLPLRE